MRKLVGTALAAAAIAVASPAGAEDMSPSLRDQMERVVHDYIVAHPEVVAEAQQAMEKRRAEETARRRVAAIEANKALLLNADFQISVGNPSAQTVLVEFFDYNCGYCKRALDDIVRLVEKDQNLRVILKDYPVLGPGSLDAALVAEAARGQLGDRAFEYHRRLLQSKGKVGKEQALDLARDMGVDMDRLASAVEDNRIREGLQATAKAAGAMRLQGTPAFVVGSVVIDGAVGYDQIRAVVDNVRRCGKGAC